jgi:metaxin
VTDTASARRHESYTSLIDHSIRNAWLFALYLDGDNCEAIAKRLYIYPTSSNIIVQKTLLHQLQQAARTELLRSRAYIAETELYLDAADAFLALSALLGSDSNFFGADVPSLFDASVFAYTHLLMDESMGWKNTTLADSVKKIDNLVQHRRRLMNLYFKEQDAAARASYG